MTRLLKLVERVEEDLDIFLNDKSMTNQQAFKEIGAKLYEVDGLTWKGGFVVKIAEQLILENVPEEDKNSIYRTNQSLQQNTGFISLILDFLAITSPKA